jgi:hypothetical protein
MAKFFQVNHTMVNLDGVSRIEFEFGDPPKGQEAELHVTSCEIFFVEVDTKSMVITREWAQELWDHLQEESARDAR